MYKLRHESYDSNTLKNDIALFKMNAPVDTSIYLPVCMPPHGANYEGKTGDKNFGQVLVSYIHICSLGDRVGNTE